MGTLRDFMHRDLVQDVILAGRRLLRPRAQGGEAAGKLLAHIIPLWRAGRPISSDGDRTALASIYRASSLAHACIREKATSVAEPEFRAELDGERLPDDDLLGELAVRPNPDMTPYEFTERIITDLDTFGEWIAQKRRSRAGIVREVWPLQVEHTEVITDTSGRIVQYEIAKAGTLAPRDVIHVKYPNPLNPWRGLSPGFVISMEAKTDRYAMLFMHEFFANQGIPSHILTTAAALQDYEKEQLRGEWRAMFGARRGVPGETGYMEGPVILSNGATIQPLGADFEKLDLAPIFDMSESRVCAVYGVPAIVVGANVGLKQSQAYGTAREGRISLWEETLAPLYVRLSQALTKGIASEFGAGYRLRYDLRLVQPLQRARSPIIRDTVLMWSQDLLTRDQALERIGEPPVDGRPVYRSDLKASEQRTVEMALQGGAGVRVPTRSTPKLPELQESEAQAEAA